MYKLAFAATNSSFPLFMQSLTPHRSPRPGKYNESWKEKQGAANPNPNGDLLLGQPGDTVSAVAWSPVAQQSGNEAVHLLAASCWDGNLLFSRVSTSGQFEATQAAAHKAPILDVAWAMDGSKVFTASCDKTALAFDFGGQQGVQVAAHDEPIKFIRHVETANGPLLVTGGWDGALRWWDGRQAQPIHSVDMKSTATCASFLGRMGVVCTGNRRVLIFDLAKGGDPWVDIESPLKFQTRSCAVFANGDGFALGSIEGRIQIHYVNLDATSQATAIVTNKCFSYKYHRDQPSSASLPTIVHSVNCVTAFKDEIFITAGSDGVVTFWNKNTRTKLGEFNKHPSPINAVAFSPDLSLMAYSAGYDWHKGIEYNDQKTFPNALLVHAITDKDLTEKNTPKTTTGVRR